MYRLAGKRILDEVTIIECKFIFIIIWDLQRLMFSYRINSCIFSNFSSFTYAEEEGVECYTIEWVIWKSEWCQSNSRPLDQNETALSGISKDLWLALDKFNICFVATVGNVQISFVLLWTELKRRIAHKCGKYTSKDWKFSTYWQGISFQVKHCWFFNITKTTVLTIGQILFSGISQERD